MPDIIVERNNHILKATFNRPNKKNAITDAMYEQITAILNSSSVDPDIRVIIFTGKGDYYSSGNDLGNFLKAGSDPSKLARASEKSVTSFVNAWINCTKIIIVGVNGPCFGIAVTTLALADFVYCSETATFETPFMKIGQSPEGCSSLLFPELMGRKANEVLLLGKPLSAVEAERLNLVNEIIPQQSLVDHIEKIANKIVSLPPQSVLYSKELIRSHTKEKLLEISGKEASLLYERWTSEECMNAISNFFMNKKPKL